MAKKKCSKCKATKPLSEFYKNKHCKDGYLNDCKTCQKIYVAKYQKTTKGKEVNRKGKKKYLKTDKGKTTLRAARKRFYALNPNQRKAVNAVNNSIRDGKLLEPDTLLCHYCPKPAQQYHHNKGYEPKHYLDVIPVCKKCHHKCKMKIL